MVLVTTPQPSIKGVWIELVYRPSDSQFVVHACLVRDTQNQVQMVIMFLLFYPLICLYIRGFPGCAPCGTIPTSYTAPIWQWNDLGTHWIQLVHTVMITVSDISILHSTSISSIKVNSTEHTGVYNDNRSRTNHCTFYICIMLWFFISSVACTYTT